MRRVAAALLAAGLVSALALTLAPAAQAAAAKKLYFVYGQDRSSWYWTRQRDIAVPPDEVGSPVTQRQRVPHRQQSNTLPVTVTNGEFEKIAAIQWDLAGRGVTPGSRITKFVLSIAEVSSSSEYPAFNFTDKKIQACRIDDFWPGGEGEVWETQAPYGGKTPEGDPPVSKPPFAPGACVDGKRDDTKAPATWTFDLTQIAQAWGENPFKNYGVMLVPELRDTWQNNLKIPAKECPDCVPPASYDTTKEFATALLAFTPGIPAPPVTPPTFGGIETGGFTAPPESSFVPPSAPSSIAEPPAVTAPAPVGAVAAPQGGPIEMQGIVWALVPLGLLAFAAARAVAVEPAVGTREGGVIESIRRKNVQRRGESLTEEEEASPLVAAKGAFSRLGNWFSKRRSSR